MSDAQTNSTAKASAIMAAGTMVSRVLGFVRTSLLAVAIGANTTMGDIFEKANTIPNIIYLLLAGGIFNVVLVPQIIKASENRDGGADFVSRLLGLTLLVMSGITVVVMLLAGPIIRLLTKDWTGPMLELGTVFALWCLPQIFFYGLYAVVGQVLNAHNRFGWYMWAPVLNNVVAIGTLVLYISLFGAFSRARDDPDLWTGAQTMVLAGGTTLGIVLQALILLWPLKQLGLGLHPKFGWRGLGFAQAGKVALWTLGTMVVGNSAYLLYGTIASSATAGRLGLEGSGPAASVPGEYALNTAQLISLLPHSVFVLSIATVLFNQLSRSQAAGDLDEVRRTINSGLRTIGVATVFGAAAMVVLGGPLGRLFAGSGATAAISAATLGQVLTILAAGMPFMSIYFFLNRVFYAEEDARTPLIMQSILSGGCALLALVLAGVVPATQVVYGLAILFAVFNVFSALLAHFFTRRRLGDYGAGAVVDTYIRLGYAALGAGLAGAGVLWLLGGYDGGGFAMRSIPTAMVAIAAVGTVMAGAYLLLLRLLRVRELDDFLAPVLRRLPGRNA
ncbi:murein biosynthesis integral membrane protein MurJ [Arthrobacter mobilis]|uniref:Murein biosynthesis integral membrane protein MurJ n=1 Tax=Arthrobacter mobilis TaxID=2724944 RepID=A0A7X6QMF6_9MICC|nr:murein biosynthesis integral membrane protein MurJ [Arthrobacter mobilis]NKX56598.1 murein biosynthesis integral membrane protein MurJ [Arthrobacter mobilis]